MKSQARLSLEAPHAEEHQASRERQLNRGIKPFGFGSLLAWFLREWSAEIPRKTHAGGVWRTTVQLGEEPPKEQIGGSLLGSPADAPPFRRYIEGRGNQRNEDGHYIWPMHAAINRIAGRGDLDARTYMASFLFAVASSAGDWEGVAFRSGIPSYVAREYLEAALHKVWAVWEPMPVPREEPDEPGYMAQLHAGERIVPANTLHSEPPVP